MDGMVQSLRWKYCEVRGDLLEISGGGVWIENLNFWLTEVLRWEMKVFWGGLEHLWEVWVLLRGLKLFRGDWNFI